MYTALGICDISDVGRYSDCKLLQKLDSALLVKISVPSFVTVVIAALVVNSTARNRC